MKGYIEPVAMQFIKQRLHPSLTDKIISKMSKPKIPDKAKVLEEWKNSLSNWSMTESASLDQENKIKELFITLDMLSFSL